MCQFSKCENVFPLSFLCPVPEKRKWIFRTCGTWKRTLKHMSFKGGIKYSISMRLCFNVKGKENL